MKSTFLRIVPTALVVASQVACSSKVEFAKIMSLQESLSGQYREEVFTQDYLGKKLDILVIVDNSISMTEEQERLGDRIDSFLSTLYDVDWRIGVTTTDVSSGPHGIKGDLLNFTGTNSHILTRATPNYQAVFKNTVVRPEGINCKVNCPSGDEQPLRAAIMAMEKHNAYNKGFFRGDADLALLILSDEDEMSSGPANATQPQLVMDTVSKIWGDKKRLITYGMIIKPGDTACYNANNGIGNYGRFIDQLATITGGLTGSICAADFSDSLKAIGDHARQLLNGVQLQLYPEDGTITISFSPSHSTEWLLMGRRIQFSEPPPKGTQIRVHYMVK